MIIYLTRHGETEWNLLGKMQGWKNSNLTQKGIAEAEMLGERLKEYKFDAVYSSPLGRAVQTTEHILNDESAKIIFLDNFKEMHFGCWEGTSHQEVKEKYPARVDNLWNNPKFYEPIDGETIEEFMKRVKQGLDIVVNDNKEGNVLLVTHALVIKCIYALINNSEVNDIWNCPRIANASLTIINVENGKMSIEMEADTSHILHDSVAAL